MVPAHNEGLVIANTTQAILGLNYPSEKVQLLLYADNCDDNTAQIMHRIAAAYPKRQIQIIERTGTGGKAGVLNDALKLATGEYIGVYDADAMPEKNALYFLVREVLKNPEHYMAAIGRNKTRNAKQNFLTKCINQEIVVTQRIQHVGIWHMFKISRIPGTNFIINKDFVESIGGWENGALTEDTDISFKIMQTGRLIALAYNSEAFQQEPERLHDYYFQRLRWAKGNYEVVMKNFKYLFLSANWRVKLEVFYYFCTFFWFNLAIVLSNLLFLGNLGAWLLNFFIPINLPFIFDGSNLLMMQMLAFNWLMMIMLFMLQTGIALATQFGQFTTEQLFISFASYFTYSQLFIVVSIHAVCSALADKICHRRANNWVKTKRFAD